MCLWRVWSGGRRVPCPARGGGTPTPPALPPPHGTTGTPASAACAMTAATSSTLPGRTAASGVRPSITYGDSSMPARTWAGPTMARSLSSSGTMRPALEALRQALSLDGVGTVRHGPRLDARLSRGEHLAGIAETTGIERVLEALHQREVGGREDERHEVGLLEPDAVLARDRAADLRAHLHDLRSGVDDTRLLAGLARIVQDVRMQVAVAGVEHVADAQPVRGDDLVHAPEHVWQLRARDDAVHHHVCARDAPLGADRGLATLPEQLALRLAPGRPHLARARVAAGGDDPLPPRLHCRRWTVQLDQPRGRRLARAAAAERVLDRLDRELGDHLHRRPHQAACDDRRHRPRRLLDAVETGGHRLHR